MKQRTKIEKRVVANSRRCRTYRTDVVPSDPPKSILDEMMNAMGWHWVETRSIPEPKQARSPYTPEDGENHG